MTSAWQSSLLALPAEIIPPSLMGHVGRDDIDALLPDRIAAAHPELVVRDFDEPELPD